MNETETLVHDALVVNDASYIELWHVLCPLLAHARDQVNSFTKCWQVIANEQCTILACSPTVSSICEDSVHTVYHAIVVCNATNWKKEQGTRKGT